ncbi:hypothetical protein [Streptomyces sp. NPDC090057]|uniref:hypothetical protein n=1 Tax=Streptomyces sp. NPDC090057 TaxID=3365935 RepID=UPI00381F3ADF
MTALHLGHAVVRIITIVLCERARRATVVAVLGLAREGATQLLVHHDPANCDVRVSYPTFLVLPNHVTGPESQCLQSAAFRQRP